MTHTLHRQGPPESFEHDYVLISMAAQGINSGGATPHLAATFDILLNSRAVNLADDNFGGIFTGVTLDQIRARINEKSYLGAVFTEEADLEELLLNLKEAQLRMSVVVRGDWKRIFALCRRIGLKPHTVNLSLGIFGKKELLPRAEVLQITSMCGHGMVCPDHVLWVADRVRKGKMSPQRAAEQLCKPCTCGLVNPVRAATLVSGIASSPLQGGESRGAVGGNL
ncbi:MAG: hypothetical protein ACYC66_05420 [Chloroflexota bacterium]